MRFKEFFAFARERHAVYLRRLAGLPPPWTDDEILRQYKFTNVFREHDRTTVWFRDSVRERMRGEPEALLATTVFRWFNRVTTAEAIFQQMRTNFSDDGFSGTAWEEFLETGSLDGIRDSVICWCGDGPYCGGAYMITSSRGMKKLDGVLQSIEWFSQHRHEFTVSGTGEVHPEADWRLVAEKCLEHPGLVEQQDVWRWLVSNRFLGWFMSYEIVTDLRHTELLCRAPDLLEWAAPGPGALRGAARMLGDYNIHPKYRTVEPVSFSVALDVMRQVLRESRSPARWPQELLDGLVHTGYRLDETLAAGSWPEWEMREAEHTLCEWDKYERALTGEGRPKARYTPREG